MEVKIIYEEERSDYKVVLFIVTLIWKDILIIIIAIITKTIIICYALLTHGVFMACALRTGPRVVAKCCHGATFLRKRPLLPQICLMAIIYLHGSSAPGAD